MGQHDYRLKSLADDELLAELSSIVGRRNQITAQFLAYLAELDERQLFLDLGFASLFEYCVERLGLCESTAGRHIAAARVCRNHPELFARVASGALHASALSLLRKHLTPENAAELFELCEHRSMRRIEELLAARFPRPDVRDLVRRLPAQARLTPGVERGSEQQPTEAPSSETTTIRQQVFEPRRRCPAAVARAVFLRDGRQCSYVSPEGRRCSARRCLELDHVNPRAVGGDNTIENLRLRCRAHNQRYARQCFGKACVDAAVQRARRQRAVLGS